MCVIDFCLNASSQTLTVDTNEGTLELEFCEPHAEALQSQLAKQLGGSDSFAAIDMYNNKLPGTIGDLQQAIAILDAGSEVTP